MIPGKCPRKILFQHTVGGSMCPPVFGRPVNPISTGGHITNCLPGFSYLPTALMSFIHDHVTDILSNKCVKSGRTLRGDFLSKLSSLLTQYERALTDLFDFVTSEGNISIFRSNNMYYNFSAFLCLTFLRKQRQLSHWKNNLSIS